MFIVQLIGIIVVGGIAGWAAEKVMKFDTGLAMSIVLGIAGSVVGNTIIGGLGLWMGGGIVRQLIVAIAGACLVIYVYRLINQRKA